jgi:hypothetical protein
MKESELRKHADCNLCGDKIGSTGLPFFYVVSIERFGIDLQAVRRQTGFGMMMGAQLAMVMGPDEDMAKPLMEKQVITVCENCSTASNMPIAAMVKDGD